MLFPGCWKLSSAERLDGPQLRACGLSLACVRGNVVHLYHGTRERRQYVERYQILHDYDYDPATDVEIDPESVCSNGRPQFGSESPIWSGVSQSILSSGTRMNEGL
jgi:hypothetical protein